MKSVAVQEDCNSIVASIPYSAATYMGLDCAWPLVKRIGGDEIFVQGLNTYTHTLVYIRYGTMRHWQTDDCNFFLFMSYICTQYS